MGGINRTRGLMIGAAVIALAGMLVLVLARGDDEEVVSFGEGSVTVEADDDASLAERARAVIVAVIEQSGYPPEVVECYDTELEGVPEDDLEHVLELQQTGATPTEIADAAKPLKRELAAKCFPPGPVDTDPDDLDENSAALLKEQFARKLETGRIGGQRVPLPAANCLAERIRSTPAADFLALLQGPPRELKRTVAELRRTCR